MTIEQMREVVSNIKFDVYSFEIVEKNGITFLCASYMEADTYKNTLSLQKTRKWHISEHAVESEIVQTALKCVLTSAEHRVREAFLYKGERVFGPHFDVNTLVEIAKERKLDYRGRKPVSVQS